MNVRSIFLVPIALLIIGSCVQGGGSGDKDADGETAAPDADAGTDLDDGADTCTPEHWCFADFPCTDGSYCADERSIGTCESVECSSPRVCGTPCCSGGTCLPSLAPPTTCPDGERCFENPEGFPYGFSGPGRSARCMPEPDADAGTDNDVDYDGYTTPDVYWPYCR